MASPIKEGWLRAAIDSIPTWIELQCRGGAQAGCVVAIALKDRLLFEQAFGFAPLPSRKPPFHLVDPNVS
jgi:hypothetical protein